MIEAVPENLDLKLSIMKSLDQIVSPDTILASKPRPSRSPSWAVR